MISVSLKMTVYSQSILNVITYWSFDIKCHTLQLQGVGDFLGSTSVCDCAEKTVSFALCVILHLIDIGVRGLIHSLHFFQFLPRRRERRLVMV